MATSEMDAKLISQADVMTSISDGTLISVSEGAGQPQKNLPYPTLQSKVMEKVSESYEQRVKTLETASQDQAARLDALEANGLVSTYTLEQSSSPAFEVSNKNAAKLYTSHMGGYLFWNGAGEAH